MRWRRVLLASVASFSLVMLNGAWAVCSDGTTLPQNGYVVGQSPLQGGAANFFVPSASLVKRMQVGNNLAVDLTTEFGLDNQPYLGGQRVINSFNSQPGGNSRAAWPN